MQGYIKLYRQIMESEFYFSEKFSKSAAWIDLLLLANHKESTFFIRGIEIKLAPGQLAYSQLTLAKRWKWNFKTVKKFLDMLELRKMIFQSVNKVTTLITIVNWSEYQDNQEINSQKNYKAKNSVKNGEQKSLENSTKTQELSLFDISNGEQNGEQKENKTETNNNDKNEKKNIYSLFENLIPTELNAIPGFTESWKDFISHRKEIKKPLTETAAKRILKKLLNYHNESNDVIKIIDNSITRGWQDVFPYTGQIQPPANKQTIEPLKFNFR